MPWVENGGFTAAGRHLNLLPTMVSNHVQEAAAFFCSRCQGEGGPKAFLSPCTGSTILLLASGLKERPGGAPARGKQKPRRSLERRGLGRNARPLARSYRQ
jgi:hypothetical protein